MVTALSQPRNPACPGASHCILPSIQPHITSHHITGTMFGITRCITRGASRQQLSSKRGRNHYKGTVQATPLPHTESSHSRPVCSDRMTQF